GEENVESRISENKSGRLIGQVHHPLNSTRSESVIEENSVTGTMLFLLRTISSSGNAKEVENVAIGSEYFVHFHWIVPSLDDAF
ncbi:hypothetical protein PMAYCL1PPCAC_15335, partial [Pristionchus mayeri]